MKSSRYRKMKNHKTSFLILSCCFPSPVIIVSIIESLFYFEKSFDFFFKWYCSFLPSFLSSTKITKKLECIIIIIIFVVVFSVIYQSVEFVILLRAFTSNLALLQCVKGGKGGSCKVHLRLDSELLDFEFPAKT